MLQKTISFSVLVSTLLFVINSYCQASPDTSNLFVDTGYLLSFKGKQNVSVFPDSNGNTVDITRGGIINITRIFSKIISDVTVYTESMKYTVEKDSIYRDSIYGTSQREGFSYPEPTGEPIPYRITESSYLVGKVKSYSNVDELLKRVNIYGCEMEKTFLSLNPEAIATLYQVNGNLIYLNGKIGVFNMSQSHVKRLLIEHCNFKKIYLSSSNIDSLDLDSINISSKILISGVNLPCAITIKNVDFSNSNVILDLTQYNPSDKQCIIKIENTDLSKIKMNYENFFIDFPETEKVELVESSYKILLDKQKEFGFLKGQEKLDIQFRNYHAKKSKSKFVKFQNWLDQYWWNYGYDKELIFIHTLYYIIFLTFLTFFILKYLNEKVYHIENIPNIPSLKNIYRSINLFETKIERPLLIIRNVVIRLWYSFIYTSTIFFKLTLKTEKINFGRIGALYLIILYTLGIVCLAYMANFVLQK